MEDLHEVGRPNWFQKGPAKANVAQVTTQFHWQDLSQLQLRPDPSQYGGIKGCSVDHMLVDMWEDILGCMEGGKTAAMLLGVDYEKAFNRMEHAECVRQLRMLGASEGSISLVRPFLEDRAMTITINGFKARPVKITRGSPQGSVLGCLLYCVTTQSLTKGLRERNSEILPPGELR